MEASLRQLKGHHVARQERVKKWICENLEEFPVYQSSDVIEKEKRDIIPR